MSLVTDCRNLLCSKMWSACFLYNVIIYDLYVSVSLQMMKTLFFVVETSVMSL